MSINQSKISSSSIRIKTCGADVRRGLEIVPCGEPLQGDRCFNRDNHQLPFPTGWCNSGWCEGFKIAKPTCKYYNTCCCKCHQDLWVMFALVDTERILIDNSTYHQTSTFVMPTREQVILENASFISNPSELAQPQRELVEAVLATPLPVTYAPTPTGRAARGELEEWTRITTSAWLTDYQHKICTPQYIAEEITRREGLGRTPSVGAIDAVLKRWERIGFAVIEKKPTRFTGYTEAGVRFGLQFLKKKAKVLK